MEETNNDSSAPTENTPMQQQPEQSSASTPAAAKDAAALMAFASVSASTSAAVVIAAPSNTTEPLVADAATTDAIPNPLVSAPLLTSPEIMQQGEEKDMFMSEGGGGKYGTIAATERTAEPEAFDAPPPSTVETKVGTEGGESQIEENSSPHQQQQSQSMDVFMEEVKDSDTKESVEVLDKENLDEEMKETTVEVSSKPTFEEPIATETGPKVAPLIAKIEEKISANTATIPSENDNKEAAGEDVQVIEHPPESLLLKKRTKSFEEHLERKKRRRKLRRMLKEAGEFPSFVALISESPNLTAEEEEEDAVAEEAKNKSPEVIYIDVDDYLGLTKPKAVEAPVPAPVVLLGRLRPNRNSPDPAVSARGNSSNTKVTASPADEGYYEGRVPLASLGDDKYLSTLQIMIRDNLEYFSATATDAAGSQSGRRYPVIQGKVGIRCIHCAKVGLEHEAALAAKMEDAKNTSVAPDNAASGLGETKSTTGQTEPKLVDASKLWPPGSISYPLNIAGLYSVCSQKPQLHFENCPNMPSQIKAQFYRYVHEAGEARIKSREVPTPMYYSVAAKRIGLVNVAGGMRFGRDLTLEPLPLEAVLAQERQEVEQKKTQVIVPDQSTFVSEPEGVVSAAPTLTSNVRTPADAVSEQVLAEAVAELDVPDRFPSRASDKAYVSDYVFLCIRQLAICRAVPADMATRGKKTKSMRIGLAGFCCKHCLSVREQIDGHELARAHGASDFSCRSFSSAPDTLASSISNTYALHLAKCTNVPARIRTALASYKRFHASQMSNLPYGSQRKCFGQIWDRLRAADVPEDDMMIRISKYKETGIVPDWPANNWSPRQPRSNGIKSSSAKPKQLGRTSPKFPVASGAEAQNVLKNAIASLESSNDNADLIWPDDLDLVSDYVFLTIRQLHVTLPTAADLSKRRPVTGQAIMAGMCCMHCEKEDPSVVAPSGRSFPSAADNFASALNTSLYNHMQNCQFLPADIKPVLAVLRKLHSQQIAHLKVGSQRRYFTKLYNRLRKVPVPKIPGSAVSTAKSTPAASRNSSRGASHVASSSGTRVTRRSENGDDAILAPFGFFEAPIQSFFCARCRMVPLALRARGSLSFARPSLDFMTEHSEACKGDGFDLWFVVESFKKLLKEKKFDLSCMTDPLFKDVIREAVGGNEDLTSIFTSELVKVYQMSRHGGVTRAVENYVKAKSEGMWCKFPRTVDCIDVSQAFEKFAATKNGISSKLGDHSALVSFLLLLSPSLSMPGEEPEKDNDDSKEDGDDEDVAGEFEGEDEVSILDEDEGGDNVEMDDDDDFKAPASIKVGAPKRGKELKRKKPSPEKAPPKEDLINDAVNVSGDQNGTAGENGANVVNGTQSAEQAPVDHFDNTGTALGLELQGDIGANNHNNTVDDGGVAEHTDADALMNEGIDETQEEDLFMSDDGSFSHG